MGEKLRVSVTHMSSDTENLKNRMNEIPKAIEELQAAMGRLGECWEGPAWSAFQNQVTDDINNMNEVHKFLRTYLERFNQSKKLYKKAEEQIYGNIEKIRI